MSFAVPIPEFHCNGVAKIYCFNPWTYLGYCSDQGVQPEFDPKFEPVYTDAFGGQVPEDVQNMGMIATLTFELIKWDQGVLSALQTHAAGASAGVSAPTLPDGATIAAALGKTPNVGTQNPSNLLVGTLLKQCGWTFPVLITRGNMAINGGSADTCETTHEGPYAFGTCYVGTDSFNLGTRNTRHRLTIHCLPNSSGVLFQIGTTQL